MGCSAALQTRATADGMCNKDDTNYRRGYRFLTQITNERAKRNLIASY